MEALALRDGTRRSHVEMMCEILVVVASGCSKPTHIAYKANLSWNVLNKSLKIMVDRGLLEKLNVGRRTCYKIAPKGNEVIALFDSVTSGLGGKHPLEGIMFEAEQIPLVEVPSGRRATRARRGSSPAL